MKLSFRVWKETVPTLNARLAQYAKNLPMTDKLNLLLKDLLGLKDDEAAPIPVVRRDPPPDSPFICIRRFKQEPTIEAQKGKCLTCQVGDFDAWRACQELRAEEKAKAAA